MVGDVTGVVLAGGKSLRMGRDKRFLRIGGKGLLDRVLSIMGQVFSEVLVVAALEDPELRSCPFEIVTDRIPGCAAIGGLYTGLFHARQPRVFAVACDMPFVNQGVVKYLSEAYPVADIVVPALDSGVQPMHAVYSKRVLPRVEEMIRRGCFKIQDLFEDQELDIQRISSHVLRTWDPQLLSFWNLNTPEDVEEAEQVLKRRGEWDDER